MKDRLVLIREKAGLSQSKFAEKINVSRYFISLVEMETENCLTEPLKTFVQHLILPKNGYE